MKHPKAKLYCFSLSLRDELRDHQEQYEMDQYEAELEEQFNEGSGFEPEAETHRLEKEKLMAEKRNKRKITVKENQEVMLNSTILYSVDVELSYGGDPNTVRMDLLHRLLITCSLVRWRTGCDYTTAAQPYGFNLDLHDEKLAPLEVLDLREYAFEGKSNGMKWMEWEGGEHRQSILRFPWNRLPNSIVTHLGYVKIKEWGGLNENYVNSDQLPLKKDERTNLDC